MDAFLFERVSSQFGHANELHRSSVANHRSSSLSKIKRFSSIFCFQVVTNSSAEETKTRDDNYQMIPIERTRVDHEHSDNVLDTNQIKTDEKEVPNNESFSENLFGGRDIDYRENNGNSTTDSDSIFELNNKCFSLAEEKYKSKELSTEQYQETLKLLQEILENEARRLTTNTTTKFVDSHSFVFQSTVQDQ